MAELKAKSPEEIRADTRFVELKKKATLAVKKVGLEGQQARVALALDVSGSMQGLFQSGVVQRACERLLALGVKFDDNGAIDIFLFDSQDYEVGELHESKFYGYIDKEILRKYRNVWGGTCYAGVMKRIVKKYSPNMGLLGGLLGKKTPVGDPAYVMFITDGDNSDKAAAERVIIEASRKPIFWQFVGIGNSSFAFLEQLDTMSGRFVDNANFFQLNDIDSIADEALYERLLAEFPSWLKLAKQKGLY